MATAQHNVIERLAGRPLAVHTGRFAAATAVAAMKVDFDPEQEDDPTATILRDGVAVAHLRGPIVSHGDCFTRAMGWSDHASIGVVADALRTEPQVRAVLLVIDSPGGDVQGMFEAAEKLEALAAEKPLYAVADHNAFSAAYALAAVAERVYVPRAGGLGSIGVVGAHVDVSQLDHNLGVKWTFLHHGAKKVDGNPHEPLSDRAREDLMAEINALGQAFVAHVAKHRGMSEDAVRAQEAGSFMGEAAVSAGLADQVGTVEDARRDLSARVSPSQQDPFMASAQARRQASRAFQRSSA